MPLVTDLKPSRTVGPGLIEAARAANGTRWAGGPSRTVGPGLIEASPVRSDVPSASHHLPGPLVRASLKHGGRRQGGLYLEYLPGPLVRASLKRVNEPDLAGNLFTFPDRWSGPH